MDTLKAGESLEAGQKLTSDSGRYALTLQADGNLVLADSGNPMWASSTNGSGADVVTMQDDGNLVLYKKEERRLRPDELSPVWASGTRGENARLVAQEDGNLVIYGGDGRALWASGTAATAGGAAQAAPAPASEGAASTAAAAAPAATAVKEKRVYTVVSGDTLWGIAQRFYGDGSKYPKIASANGIANPDLIRPGQKLDIPD